MSIRTRPIRSRLGATLVELVVFMVIVGVAMAAVFTAFNTMTAGSASPQVRKQVLAIAESLMEEVALMPFTWCDPDDSAAPAATGTGSCTAPVGGEVGATTVGQATTAEGGEGRYSTTAPFDNVNDYHRFAMSPIQDIQGNNVDGLAAYSADIRVTQAALGPGAEAIAATESLLISVTVTGPGSVSVTLEGYRTRYAPTTLP